MNWSTLIIALATTMYTIYHLKRMNNMFRFSFISVIALALAISFNVMIIAYVLACICVLCAIYMMYDDKGYKIKKVETETTEKEEE